MMGWFCIDWNEAREYSIVDRRGSVLTVGNEALDVTHVSQFDKDSVFVCYDSQPQLYLSIFLTSLFAFCNLFDLSKSTGCVEINNSFKKLQQLCHYVLFLSQNLRTSGGGISAHYCQILWKKYDGTQEKSSSKKKLKFPTQLA